MTGRERLVVVGNGMAGARTVEEILMRGGGDRFRITVFGDEPHGSYNRILLSAVLAGHEHAENIVTHPFEWYADRDVTLHAGVRVLAIDRVARRVLDDRDGRTPFDKLIVATGSRPFVPPIAGLGDARAPRPGVFVFRTIEDCRAIAGWAGGSRRAAVIGGGLLGLEAARGLLGHGLEVQVLEAGPCLMGQQLDESAATILRETLEGMGIVVHTGAITAAILGEDRITGLALRDGGQIACDMVVVAAGVRPNTDLATECGLPVDRAIVVDDQLRSAGDPDVYAVGECAQHRGTVYGLVAPLWEQASVLADHVTGADPRAAYLGSKLVTKLKVMGVDLAVMGVKSPGPGDELVQYAEPARGVYEHVIVRDGRIVGATLLGEVGRVPFLTQAFDLGTPLPTNRAALLFDFGEAAEAVSALDLPDDARICNCNGVRKRDISRCLAEGASTVADVMRVTRAGTGCGTCASRVRELVDAAEALSEGRSSDEMAAPATR